MQKRKSRKSRKKILSQKVVRERRNQDVVEVLPTLTSPRLLLTVPDELLPVWRSPQLSKIRILT